MIAQIAEVFREHGYEGASLTLIEAATGLGKGSLYHFFPDGKEQMAAEVIADIAVWFEENLFSELAGRNGRDDSIEAMFDLVCDYFRSGRRVCLVGVLALSDGRDRFAARLRSYFVRWVEALTLALARAGVEIETATALAEEIVQGLQGAIVLARALDDPTVFDRAVARFRARALAVIRAPARGDGDAGF
ncbi:MAG TPA: TetR/AcrR family transcriptional regulator [Phenylobacterium sp.]|nr:TetR/AcrR family transcriptional regulator [Phenylobacterium sp.]